VWAEHNPATIASIKASWSLIEEWLGTENVVVVEGGGQRVQHLSHLKGFLISNPREHQAFMVAIVQNTQQD
jgi:hypothetical protein